MNYKFPIIGGTSLLIIITMLSVSFINSSSSTNDENLDYLKDDINENQFTTEIIVVKFEPSEIKGLNREYPIDPIKFEEQDLEDVPKIKQMLDYTISASDISNFKEPLIYSVDDSSKYVISKIGPFSYQSELHVIEQELNQFHLWVSKNLVSVPIYQQSSIHYLEYKGEVFKLTFETIQ